MYPSVTNNLFKYLANRGRAVVLPISIHPVLRLPEEELEKNLEEAMDMHRKDLPLRIAMAASHDLWMKNAVIPHLFSLIPHGWKISDIAAFLGIDKGNVSRIRERQQTLSIEKARYWIDAFQSTFPGVGDRIYFAHGVVSAIHHMQFERDVSQVSDPRRRIAIPVNESSLEDTAILFALVTPPVFDEWKRIAISYSDDLEAAFETTEFTECLANLIHSASSLFGNYVVDPVLRNAQDSLAGTDLDSPAAVLDLTKRIVRLWDYSCQLDIELLKAEIGSYFNMS
jgi:hypothetical protein